MRERERVCRFDVDLKPESVGVSPTLKEVTKYQSKYRKRLHRGKITKCIQHSISHINVM